MTTKDWDKVHKEGKQYSPVSEIVLDKVLQMYPSGSVLDIGCGSGELTRQLKARGYDVTGVDISKEGIKKAKEADKDINYVCSDFMEFEGTTYDVIFINLVLAFAKDKQAFLDKAKSMLKPGGQVVLITPVLLWKYVTKYSPHLKEISVTQKELDDLNHGGYMEVESHYFADYGVAKTLVLL